MTRLTVDLELCEGYGNCIFEADDYCELTEDGVVRLVRQDVPAADLARVELAVASCPVSALQLENR
ncbi:ferredoxin [Acrocarpospora catenulata]|uniref:ferredoxin n=1 Tax=Acrocarpospora catenulata TaxID=2836182 RepID=UPI001BD96A54|nr:ferredoxin [Acrocarpospora catenulata]